MNARKATRRPLVNVQAFDELIAAYGGIQSFAAEVEHDRKTVWAWRNEHHTPAPILQRSINTLAARQKIPPPYPEAVADTRIRSTVRAEVLDEAIVAMRAAGHEDAVDVLTDLKTRAAS